MTAADFDWDERDIGADEWAELCQDCECCPCDCDLVYRAKPAGRPVTVHFALEAYL